MQTKSLSESDTIAFKLIPLNLPESLLVTPVAFVMSIKVSFGNANLTEPISFLELPGLNVKSKVVNSPTYVTPGINEHA